jgi:hypothetical protein
MTVDINAIQERNARVEADKAWEVSTTRKVIIAVITYLVAALYMQALGASLPWLNALIPVGGYLLSTLSLPVFKNLWLEKVYRK